MKSSELLVEGGNASHAEAGEGQLRIRLKRPVTVRHKETQNELKITEFETVNAGEAANSLFVGEKTPALDPADYEIVKSPEE